MAEYKAELLKNGGNKTTDSGWQTLISTPIQCTYRKINDIVYVQCSARNVSVSEVTFSLGTIPEGYRPAYRTAVRNGYHANNDGYLEIQENGAATFTFTATGSGKYCHCNTAYPVA